MGTIKSNCDDYYALPAFGWSWADLQADLLAQARCSRSLFQATDHLPLWLSTFIPIYVCCLNDAHSDDVLLNFGDNAHEHRNPAYRFGEHRQSR
jgi:hypothetical protein